MNSEQLRVIQEFNIPKPDKAEFRASQVINDIQELVESKGWQILKKDLGGIRDGLINALLDAKTLKEAQALQARIKNLDLFMNIPKKYLSQSKTYLNRRSKWQKK